jgi:hypothetical protein
MERPVDSMSPGRFRFPVVMGALEKCPANGCRPERNRDLRLVRDEGDGRVTHFPASQTIALGGS